jgi:cytochrome c
LKTSFPFMPASLNTSQRKLLAGVSTSALFLTVLQPTAACAAGDIAAGQRIFAQCASCHQIGGSAGAAFGPQLTDIVGRRAGATTDYRYSTAMKQSNIVWTEARLAAFLRDPAKVVPGTKMRFWGFSDERQIADLIAYLKSVK